MSSDEYRGPITVIHNTTVAMDIGSYNSIMKRGAQLLLSRIHKSALFSEFDCAMFLVILKPS